MEENQSKKSSSRIVSSITLVWTICFLLAQSLSFVVGKALMNSRWPLPNADSWTFVIFGLAVAISLSGLFTTLILRKDFPQLKLRQSILIVLGWGIVAMIVWFALSLWMSSD